VGICWADSVTLYCPQKLVLILRISGGQSVGIVRLLTRNHGDFSLLFTRHHENSLDSNRTVTHKFTLYIIGFTFILHHLWTTVISQNLIQREIKRRLYSGNACCHSVQNILSSRLLSKNVKIRVYKTILFACGSIRVWNMVSDIKGGTLTEGVWEQGAEENIWTKEGWSAERMQKTA
jgi:hypothetical protein